ncbi:cytochrome c biogenesis protein [Neolewinella antarctica]|uniref:Heme exporter protein C n=1 Tax=Neolewinella antarctica TaxID=442734 RepID=A0ABX0X7I7_9BACT|nr:cytochrome c biogenesis protein CcsA [Neolewinella antarctica]NJC24944.1 heme exporter protein C [Neolewinella antarctica]
MEKMMRKSWWKWLGVALVVYGIVAGLLVPLKPNAYGVMPGSATLGQTETFEMLGYNTSFLGADAGAVNAWVRAGEGLALRADRIEIIDDRRAKLTFTFPEYLPENDVPAGQARALPIIMTTDNDGTFVVPDAVTLRQVTTPLSTEVAETGWTTGAIVKGDLFPSQGITFPYRNVLLETIRNTYFHVSLWFAMMFLFIAGVVYAIKYLRRSGETMLDGIHTVSRRDKADYWAVAFTSVGMLFGILGLLTGAVWAKYTWGTYWSWDIKQFTTLIALLIYGGYFALRAALPDAEQRARLSAAYNIFAFACLIPLIYILPRLVGDSLHPGAAGNPAMGGEDLDSTMRMVFYPIIIGWTLFGFWMACITFRARVLLERTLRV